MNRITVKIFFFISVAVFLNSTQAKAQVTVSGHVFDKETGEQLPGVSVYIPNSSIGVSGDKSGFFELNTKLIPPFQVNISFIGYQTIAIQVEQSVSNLELYLEPKTLQMNEVLVEATKDFHWRDFLDYFLGQSTFSKDCKIVNIEDVIVYFDKGNNRLEAYADKPIIVENKALGYRISYWLDTFVMDYATNITTMLGSPQFEDLLTDKTWRWTKRKWERNRKSAYLGSLNHFVRSVYHQSIKEDGFKVGLLKRVPVSNVYPDSIKHIDTLSFSNTTLARIYQKANQEGGTFGETMVDKVKLWFWDDNLTESIRLKFPKRTDAGVLTEILQLTKLEGVKDSLIWEEYVMDSELERQAKRGYINMLTQSDVPVEQFINRQNADSVWIQFPDFLYISYTKEPEERVYQQYFYGNYDTGRTEQISILSIPYKHAVRLLSDGNFSPAGSFLVERYWSFEKLDKLLPLDLDVSTFSKN